MLGKARETVLDVKKAQKLHNNVRVLEAAKLGLPKAQGGVAMMYYLGRDGVEKDEDKCFEWRQSLRRGRLCSGMFIPTDKGRHGTA